MRRGLILFSLAAGWALLLSHSATIAQTGGAHTTPAWQAARQSGAIILLRHANAPGVGDPPNFKLDDCGTQRNLDESGRAQAVRLGQTFKARQVTIGRVAVSRWCRTLETARLAFSPTPVVVEPAFNSFFSDRSVREAQTDAARKLLASWRGPGALVVVTHQVNITALTGLPASSGDGVVMRVNPQGALEVVGPLPTD